MVASGYQEELTLMAWQYKQVDLQQTDIKKDKEVALLEAWVLPFQFHDQGLCKV